MTRWVSSQVHKDCSTYANQSMSYTTLKRKSRRSYDHLNRWRKRIWQRPISTHDKKSYQSGYRGAQTPGAMPEPASVLQAARQPCPCSPRPRHFCNLFLVQCGPGDKTTHLWPDLGLPEPSEQLHLRPSHLYTDLRCNLDGHLKKAFPRDGIEMAE